MTRTLFGTRPTLAVNDRMGPRDIERHCRLDGASRAKFVETVNGDFSIRARHHVLRIARTVADLEGHTEIEYEDLVEALGYRNRYSFPWAATKVWDVR